MKIRDWNKINFTKKSKISWPCPNCYNSTLEFEKDSFSSKETAQSKRARENEHWEYEWINLICGGILNCKNCGETVTVTGSGRVEHVHYYDQYTDNFNEELVEEFTPEFFHPPLRIFKIPEQCPEIVREEIINSFKLFWFDLPSCANKIRTSLELLLSEEKVVKTTLDKKRKRRRLKLHERIVEYRQKKPQVADFLLAIKWIGNTGSHTGTLERADILDAYELLEYSLDKLYNDKELKMLKITAEINKRKGLRKK